MNSHVKVFCATGSAFVVRNVDGSTVVNSDNQSFFELNVKATTEVTNKFDLLTCIRCSGIFSFTRRESNNFELFTGK